MLLNTRLDKSSSRQENELAHFRDGIAGITGGGRVVASSHELAIPLLSPARF